MRRPSWGFSIPSSRHGRTPCSTRCSVSRPSATISSSFPRGASGRSPYGALTIDRSGFRFSSPSPAIHALSITWASLGTYVDLGLRRQGIATRLFDATFEAALRKGYEKIFTFVRADNPAALQTYLRHGFLVIGTARQHAKIDGRYVDEILIERSLACSPTSRE